MHWFSCVYPLRHLLELEMLFFVLQAALYALEDGGMSVCRVERKHFMAALSTVKPSLTAAQLEKCKLTR